jgi:multiple sugar transport system permease protein
VLITLLIATPATFALSKLKIRGANVYLLLILVSQMIPGIVIANSLYSLYVKIHLLNTFPGIILAVSTMGIPFSILLMSGFMRNISRDIMEAAEMDGAKPFRMFRSIIVPMSRNVIITSAVFTFLFAWGDFVYSVTLISKQSMQPVTVSLYDYIGADTVSWSPILATAVLSSLPAIVLLISSQKYIKAGVTAGSVK